MIPHLNVFAQLVYSTIALANLLKRPPWEECVVLTGEMTYV
jgi:hypothetical protein